ncbi:MAG: 2-oxoglutarate dehydrogenase complex dihydrolipoyllysine-residue succinyltransferase [Micavibrio aeruginosavorus]|nr:2-oxoglutarate dehydrogenase complex dihydrolipoyllysine-residue succinyltransferase [Micavibrio aeruginosavorus]
MAQIVVPTLGESVSEATVAQWLKKEGDAVAADEPIVELETDKVTLEVNAPAAGTLVSISVKPGESVKVGALLGEIGAGSAANDTRKPEAAKAAPAPAPAAAVAAAPVAAPEKLAPAVRKMVDDNNLNPAAIAGTGRDGRLTKEDVIRHASAPAPQVTTVPAAPRETGPREERVRMTRLRQRIAQRLKEAQNTAAMLTTFNEVDMTAVMELRNRYKDAFEKKHGVKLGFMSFFVRAAVNALKELPAVNAEISGDDIIYKNYYDLGVAVSTPQGLVVPVVRDCDTKSMAQIEKDIGDMGLRARDGKLGIEEMTGGTFTITNGGVFGSLMSTPILNTPQSGILGMHKIQQRPVVMPDGSIAARPMMYLALSYDHRIIDGREAVTFLVKIKDAIEDPQRLILDL